MVTMNAAPQFVSEQVFGHDSRSNEILILALCLAAVIAYNYLTEMLTALRMVRVSSVLQFVNTTAFAGLSVVLLATWRADAMAIVVAYGGSCLLLVIVAIGWLAWAWPRLPTDKDVLERGEVWAKLLPFALWVWTTNLLYNLFEVVDRYMVVHYADLPDPQAQIGQYHSAQVVPLLIVSVAGILAGMILPHLAKDWESGRREQVKRTLNLTIKLLGLAVFRRLHSCVGPFAALVRDDLARQVPAGSIAVSARIAELRMAWPCDRRPDVPLVCGEGALGLHGPRAGADGKCGAEFIANTAIRPGRGRGRYYDGQCRCTRRDFVAQSTVWNEHCARRLDCACFARDLAAWALYSVGSFDRSNSRGLVQHQRARH